MLKRIISGLVKVIQKIIIFISLTLIYFIGLGITWLFVATFKRKVLRPYAEDDLTFWVKAGGYGEDIDASLRQS